MFAAITTPATVGELITITAATAAGEILWQSTSDLIGNTTSLVAAGVGLGNNAILLASVTDVVTGATSYAFQGSTVQLGLPDMELEVDCVITVVGDIGAACTETTVWYERLERKGQK